MIAVWDTTPFEEHPEVCAARRGKARAESAHYRDVQIAREIAREVCRDVGVVSADDVRRVMSARFPDTEYGNWMGSVFRGSEFEPAGAIKSTTPGSHSNRLVLWRLKCRVDSTWTTVDRGARIP